jgi:hypothetical protein
MTLRDLRHVRPGWPRIGEQDVTSKVQEAKDGPLLIVLLQLLERSGKVTSCSEHGRTTCPVEPRRGPRSRRCALARPWPIPRPRTTRGTRYLTLQSHHRCSVGDDDAGHVCFEDFIEEPLESGPWNSTSSVLPPR